MAKSVEKSIAALFSYGINLTYAILAKYMNFKEDSRFNGLGQCSQYNIFRGHFFGKMYLKEIQIIRYHLFGYR